MSECGNLMKIEGKHRRKTQDEQRAVDSADRK